MSKLLEIDGQPGYYIFDCPGCGNSHFLNTNQQYGGVWKFDGNFDKPTCSPSFLVNSHDPKSRCHFFIRNGQIQYLNDCHHSLKGKTVDMIDLTTDTPKH
jgi:hypothetical protein